jgi:MoaE-MoaD fusion protein
MMVTVRFFASYADRIGSKEMRIALSPDASVGDLLQSVARLPGGASLPRNPLVAVNHTYASPDTLLNAGDEIAVIPPVSGG